MKFNQEFAIWLQEQQSLLEGDTAQQDIFTMIKNKEGFNLLDDHEKELIMKLLETTLSLYFILKNNPKETQKLINYLE